MSEFFAGAMSGIAQILVGHPFDTLKVRMQNSLSIRDMKPSHYFRGILYPLGFSMLVNSIGFGVYENIYKYNRNHITAGALSGLDVAPLLHFRDIGKIQRQIGNHLTFRSFMTTHGIGATMTRESIAFGAYYSSYHYLRERNHNILVSGGTAGLINWTLTYPIDVIRTRMYAQRIGALKAIAQKQFWRGYSFCAIRAVIVNSVGFWVYERFLRL